MKNIKNLEKLITENIENEDIKKSMLNELSSIYCSFSDLKYSLDDKDKTINDLKRNVSSIERNSEKIKKALLVLIDEHYD